MKINYYENIGLENLNKEYKLFTLINNIPLDLESAKYYCKTNLIIPNLNKYVLKNIKIYIVNFLPKNIYAFLNSNLNADLYIGVDDNGYVKGIPFIGNFLEFYKYYIYIYIYIFLYFCDNNNNINISKYVEINFIDVNIKKKNYKQNNLIHPRHSSNIHPSYIPRDNSNIHPSFIKFIKDEKIYINILNNYRIELNEWFKNHNKISKKIVDYANNLKDRNNIIESIKKHKFKEKYNLINLFKSSYIFQNENGLEIKRLKDDKNSPYYWITGHKDKLYNDSMRKKPIKPECLYYYDRIKSIPFRLINCLDLIPYWIKHNKNIKIFVIQIKIKKHDTNEKYFYNNKIPIRSIKNNGPHPEPYVKLC